MLKADYTVAHPNAGSLAQDQVPEGVTKLQWDTSVTEGALPEADLVLAACGVTAAPKELETLAQTAYSRCKEHGFVLICHRSALIRSRGVPLDGKAPPPWTSLSRRWLGLEIRLSTGWRLSRRRPIEYDGRPLGENVWLLAEDVGVSGIVGLTNCLREETGGRHVRCVFDASRTSSSRVSDFSPGNEAYKQLMERDLVMNVYRDGHWGSYRHRSTKWCGVVAKETPYAFLRVRAPGDLSSLQWYESPLGYAPHGGKSGSGGTVYDVYYAALNFHDVLLATGKVQVEPTHGLCVFCCFKSER
ncbi:hypothetical protein MTO96_040148 [Rhipicephalus appendiculatus]